MTENFRLGMSLGKDPDYFDHISQVTFDLGNSLAEEGYVFDPITDHFRTSFKILDYAPLLETNIPRGVRILYRAHIKDKHADYSLNFERTLYEKVIGNVEDPIHILTEFRFVESGFRRRIECMAKDLARDILGDISPLISA